MEKDKEMGNACGQSSEHGNESAGSPRAVAESEAAKQALGTSSAAGSAREAQAETQPRAHAHQDTKALNETLNKAIGRRPPAVPAPEPGTSLLTWMKHLIRPDAAGAVDLLVLDDVYRRHFPPPHLPTQTFARMTFKVFDGKEMRKAPNGNPVMLGVRWLTWSELTTRRDPVHDAAEGKPVSMGMTEIQRNAKRAMENLLTLGGGKLPVKQTASASGEGTAGAGNAPATQAVHNAGGDKGDAGEHEQASQTQPTGATPEEGKSEQAAGPRKKTPAEELEELKVSEWWHPIVEWLRTSIIQDRRGAIDSLDVKSAYDAKTWDLKTKPHVSEELVTEILFDIAPGVKDGFVYEADCKPPIIVGLSWSAIERPCVSVAIPYPLLPEKMRNEAHKLLHIADPERTQLWLKTIFSIDTGSTTSFPTLWELYERVFWRWADTHPYLKMDDFLQTVLRTFKGCRAVPVSDDYHVILGLRPNKEQKTAKEVLAYKQRRDLWRLKQKGEIDAPKSAFAQKLAQDPLLMRPTHDNKGRPLAGSFADRLRRRAGDAESEQREPFGDEEPGFPGLSMKREQVRHKSELEKAEKQMAELAKESPFPPAPPPQSFPRPEVPLAPKTAPRRVVSRPDQHLKPDVYCYGYPSDESVDGRAPAAQKHSAGPQNRINADLLSNFIERHLGDSEDWQDLMTNHPKVSKQMLILWTYMEDVGREYPALLYDQKVQKLKDTFAADMAAAASTGDAKATGFGIERLREIFPNESDEVVFQTGIATAVETYLTEELMRTYWSYCENGTEEGALLEE